MSRSIENLKEKFLKCKKAFERKELKINLKKIKVIVSGSKSDYSKVNFIHVPNEERR